MKYLLIALPLFLVISCTKEINAPSTVLMEKKDTAATVVKTGQFQNGPFGTVTGKALVVKDSSGNYAVVLDSFMTSNGPDLYVYLSKQQMPVDFIEAGKLKSTNGSQVYPLAAMPDLAQYRYVCIHCKAYNHLFGYALLP